jgi:hypothetical protein
LKLGVVIYVNNLLGYSFVSGGGGRHIFVFPVV